MVCALWTIVQSCCSAWSRYQRHNFTHHKCLTILFILSLWNWDCLHQRTPSNKIGNEIVSGAYYLNCISEILGVLLTFNRFTALIYPVLHDGDFTTKKLNSKEMITFVLKMLPVINPAVDQGLLCGHPSLFDCRTRSCMVSFLWSDKVRIIQSWIISLKRLTLVHIFITCSSKEFL